MNNLAARLMAATSMALLLMTASASTLAQAGRSVAPPARTTDEALLNEVRLIRETLQLAQDTTQRDRMVVERMRMHDERVERLGRQIAEVRDEIGGIKLHLAQLDEREAAIELQIEQAKDPNQRRALESELKESRFSQEMQAQRLQRLQDRDAALTAQLQKEERSLRTLEARLEALDRELEAAARRTDKPKVGGR